jgi:hypothetical protein
MAYERPEGVTDAEWDSFNRDIERVEEGLRTRICPDCRGKLVKKLDPVQDLPGIWFIYKCQGCNFSVDQCETN